MRLGPVDHLTVLVPSLAAETHAWALLGAQAIEAEPLSRSRALRLGRPQLELAPATLCRLPGILGPTLHFIEWPSAEAVTSLSGWSALGLAAAARPAVDERALAAAGWHCEADGEWRSPGQLRLRWTDESQLALQLAVADPATAAAFYLGLGALRMTATLPPSVQLRGAQLSFLAAGTAATNTGDRAGLLLVSLQRSDELGRRSPLAGESQILSGPGGELLELL